MLQEFGFIKYNKNFLIENNLNINPIYSPKSINYKNYLNLNSTNNCKNKSSTKKSKLSLNNKYNSRNKENTHKIDKLFLSNINRFITESTNIFEKPKTSYILMQINHKIDDDYNFKQNKLLTTSSPTNFKNIKKITNDSIKRKRKFNGIKNRYIMKNKENKNDIYYNDEINLKREIKNKIELIKQLTIKNNSLLNKIKLLENEYKNNLKNSTEIDKNFNANLHNSQNIKVEKKIIDKDLLYLKENIIELKNKLSISNSEQISINLLLFKEKMENELLKEDINKMNKLIENTNREKEEIKNEIELLQEQNKQIMMNIKMDINKHRK